jgi:UPF0755 protein
LKFYGKLYFNDAKEIGDYMSELEATTKKQKKTKKKRKVLFVFSVFVFVLLVAVVSSFVSYKYIIKNLNMQGQQSNIVIADKDKISVYIPSGSGSSAIAEILKKEGFIKNPYLFKLLSRINGYDGTYQAGTHEVSKKLGYTDLMRILVSKPFKDPSIKVTIPEGFTYKQLILLLKKNKLIDEDKFNNYADTGNFDYQFLKDIPKKERRLEGFLFPETYNFEAKGGENIIIDTLLKQFDKVFTPELYEKAKELNMSVKDIVILASIIEREAKSPDDRPIIAGVFYNRLKSKDQTLRRLQSCATIQYIFYYKEGIIKDTILDADTKVEDPYNTYIHQGLPPGPICSPGEDSILAALNPEKTDYFYFVAKDDGSGEHYFSKTYSEHLKAQSKAKANAKALKNN